MQQITQWNFLQLAISIATLRAGFVGKCSTQQFFGLQAGAVQNQDLYRESEAFRCEKQKNNVIFRILKFT